jgi:hypothetical protein
MDILAENCPFLIPHSGDTKSQPRTINFPHPARKVDIRFGWKPFRNLS